MKQLDEHRAAMAENAVTKALTSLPRTIFQTITRLSVSLTALSNKKAGFLLAAIESESVLNPVHIFIMHILPLMNRNLQSVIRFLREIFLDLWEIPATERRHCRKISGSSSSRNLYFYSVHQRDECESLSYLVHSSKKYKKVHIFLT